MPSDYISPSEASIYCGYNQATIRLWAEAGKIKFIRTPGGKRFYYLPDIREYCGIKESVNQNNNGKIILYARVSSAKQKPELDRQIEFLKERYPNEEIIFDIASGLDFNRKGLQQLLKEIASEDVGKVVVTRNDRLCRYGIELLEWIFIQYSVELITLNEEENPDTEEFAKDILDICDFFVTKYNVNRPIKRKKPRRIRLIENEDVNSPIISGSESTGTESATDREDNVKPHSIIRRNSKTIQEEN